MRLRGHESHRRVLTYLPHDALQDPPHQLHHTLGRERERERERQRQRQRQRQREYFKQRTLLCCTNTTTQAGVTLPAPARRPWPCPRRGLRSCGRPGSAPTPTARCTRCPAPTHPAAPRWPAAGPSPGPGEKGGKGQRL